MACISPITLKRESGLVTVPCGKCYGCLKRKRSDWLLRLEHENKVSSRSLFVTLTYDDQHIPKDSEDNWCFRKEDLQKYFKRLRKHGTFRYYVVSEYGGRYGRPHYHAIFFNFTPPLGKVSALWHYGHVHIGSVTPASINYCAGYVITKKQYRFEKDDPRQPFALMSKNPGIGVNYVKSLKKYHRDGLKPYGVREFGQKVALPRYYSEKIFNKVQRAIISKVYRQECEVKGVDPVLNYEKWKKEHPNLADEYYFSYRTELIEKRSEKLFINLKQNRDVKDF